MIAALFVESRGVYAGLPDVDPWDIKRDARTYAGPHPVVAHPPCQRWGRYWHGGPSIKERKTLGDDDGCFASALESVRKFGGVIEHPEASHAWETFKLAAPPKFGGWIRAGDGLGWTCCVEQGNYGHKARKATWLYVVGVNDLPELKWGAANVTQRVDGCGFHTSEERRAQLNGKTRSEWLAERGVVGERLSKYERLATPLPFRDLLIDIARRADPQVKPFDWLEYASAVSEADESTPAV